MKKYPKCIYRIIVVMKIETDIIAGITESLMDEL